MHWRHSLIVLMVLPCVLQGADRDKAKSFLPGAEALYKEGKYEQALDFCSRALSEDDAFPAAHFLIGQCQEQLNKPRDAFKSYENAAALAKKENDVVTAKKASLAAEKLGAGLILISAADEKLVTKLLPLAKDAQDSEHYETAKSAYQAILAVQPTNDKAKEGLAKTESALEARGDPIKSKIAAATLGEIFYLVGIGKKDEAKKMAAELIDKHGSTPAGKEAEQLLARNFGPPKQDDLVTVRNVLKEQQAKAKAVPVAVKVTATAAPVDVDTLEKTASDDAKKVGKDKLATTFKETLAKGREFYSKATPGSEGNQKNVVLALEQFIRCESLYLRLDDEKLTNESIDDAEKQASMLRYACMKMIILSH